MPKSKKRKNPGVGIDFKKAKYKARADVARRRVVAHTAPAQVGRSVPKGANETDVSFKARSITLPQQGVAQDKASAAALTAKNQSVKVRPPLCPGGRTPPPLHQDLLRQCGHYNERMRKDALLGLADLMQQYPHECQRHTAQLIDKCDRHYVADCLLETGSPHVHAVTHARHRSTLHTVVLIL